MTLPVVICDDSVLARNLLARSLPTNWEIEITFASNGQEALEAIRQGKGDLLFLDLNMPVMDGYQTLEAIRSEDLASLVLVVSGDIQAEAKKRVMALGALDFINKPVDPTLVVNILKSYGILGKGEYSTSKNSAYFESEQQVDLIDVAQEVVNIAMGQAGKQLGELLGTFIYLPVPRVHLQPYQDLPNLITLRQNMTYSGVSQGFIGSGIAGEALVIISSDSLPILTDLLSTNQKNSQENSEANELEVLTGLAGLLAGACLKGIAEQLDVQFSLGHPALLGQHTNLYKILGKNQQQKVLAINLDYQLVEKGIQCDLLLVFTEDSLPALTERMGCLNDQGRETN